MEEAFYLGRARFVHNRTKSDHSDDFEDEECDERDQLLPQSLPPVIRFDHLREPKDNKAHTIIIVHPYCFSFL